MKECLTLGRLGEDDEDSLFTSVFPIKNFESRPSQTAAEELIEENYYWVTGLYMATYETWVNILEGLNLFTTLDKTEVKIKKIRKGWLSKELVKTISVNQEQWDSLLTMTSDVLLNKGTRDFIKCYACELIGVSWARLDNWGIVKYLLCDSGLFERKEDNELHLEDSRDNYIFKPEGKQVAIFGVSDLVIIDTDDCLLIGTPESLYDNL
jgi:mannose-1-phosphate guanylyltransferase